jgi:hypothetical protein
MTLVLRTTALLLAASAAGAQSIPGAVLAKREPHHHMVYEDSTIRVLRVRVPAHDTTLLHEHDPDYFWIALGASTLVNAKPGTPDATVTSPDLAFHYSFGNFAHVARNPGDGPFDNITVELLGAQTDVRNLCEPAVANKPLDCPTASGSSEYFNGAAEHPALASTQLRVSLLTVPPGETVKPTARARHTWIIALDTVDTRSNLAIERGGKWVGGTMRGGDTWVIANRGRAPVRMIAVVETRAAR